MTGSTRAKREEQMLNLLRWNTGYVRADDVNNIRRMSERELKASIRAQQYEQKRFAQRMKL